MSMMNSQKVLSTNRSAAVNIEIFEITTGNYEIKFNQGNILSKQDLERLVIEIQKILLYSKS